MEATVTASDFRRRFPEIVKRVQQGETLVAISNSRPVFKVIPIETEEEPESWLMKMKQAPASTKISIEEINEIIHDVRKSGK
jgi:prevent-host-death family protein